MGINVKENDVIVLKVKIAGYPFEIGSKFTVNGIDENNKVITISSSRGIGFMSFDELDRFFEVEVQKEQWSDWKYTSPSHSAYNIEYRTKGKKTQVKIKKHSISFNGSVYRLEEDKHDLIKAVSIAELKALQSLIAYELELTKADNIPQQSKKPKVKIDTKFKVGQRVIPFQRSVYTNFDKWLNDDGYKTAKFFKEDGYLTIISIDNDGELNCGRDSKCTAFFLESDLIPYVEKPIEFKVSDKVVPFKLTDEGCDTFDEWLNHKTYYTSKFFRENGYLIIKNISDNDVECADNDGYYYDFDKSDLRPYTN